MRRGRQIIPVSNQLKVPVASKLRIKYSTLGMDGKFSEVCR